MSRHTAGPWKVIESGDGSFSIEDSSEVYVIAQRSSWHSRIPESLANACLIAAAPDLLDALKAIYEWQAGSEVLPLPVWEKMRAAISKAEALNARGRT